MDARCAEASLTPGRFCHPHRFNGSIPAGTEVYEARSRRSICPFVMPCEPIEACGGNNTCTHGYVSYYESYMEDGSLEKNYATSLLSTNIHLSLVTWPLLTYYHLTD